MNRDDIIRMAEESGGQDQRFTPETGCRGLWVIHIDGLEHFAKLVAAAEREACARVCEGRANGYRHETDVYAHEHIAEANYCAAAIRAREA